jgi:hypothetical protein
MDAVYPFASGMITMGFLLASVFFLRFWSRTRDALFLAFAAAFFLLAANQGLVSLLGLPREDLSRVYLLRILAFALIIAGSSGRTGAWGGIRPGCNNGERRASRLAPGRELLRWRRGCAKCARQARPFPPASPTITDPAPSPGNRDAILRVAVGLRRGSVGGPENE